MAKQEKTAAERYREERKARIAKAAKKNQKKHNRIILTKPMKIAISVVLVIALAAGIGAFAISESGILERNKVAFKVGTIEVTLPEYSYYYVSVMNKLMSDSYSWDSYYGQGMGAMYTGYDWSVTPDKQAYPGEIEGVESPMFSDYIEDTAKESAKNIKALVIYANENNITLTAEDKTTITETMTSLETTATENSATVSAYLRSTYGKGMTRELYEKIIEEQVLATRVQTVKTAEFEAAVTDEDIDTEYSENIDTYGEVDLRSYTINAETVAAKEGDTAAVTDETMAEAKKKAEAFVEKAKDAESFKATASEYYKVVEDAANADKKDEEKTEDYKNYLTDDSKTLSEGLTKNSISVEDEDFLEWAFNKKTKVGKTYILENEGKGYTVYMMENPLHKAADTVSTYDVRHILIKYPETSSSTTTTETTTAQAETTTEAATEAETEATTEAEGNTEQAKTETKVELLNPEDYKDVVVDIDVDLENTKYIDTYKQAQDILEDYLDGSKNETDFAELAKKHSADGNAEEGGIYEDVELGQMVEEFENWAIEEGRKKGDVGIVETQYGYHIMYFVGSEVTTWRDTIKSDLTTAASEAFLEELYAKENVAISQVDDKSLAKSQDYAIDYAKSIIRNVNQQTAA